MSQQTRMSLSKLDKQVLRQIVALFLNLTGIRVKEGVFRYTAEDIRRQLTFGGDFTYGFGDFFKLLFVRSGTKRSEEDSGKYDILFHFTVELDNAGSLKKGDKLYEMRKRRADEAEEKLDEYLRDKGLAIESQTGARPLVAGSSAP